MQSKLPVLCNLLFVCFTAVIECPQGNHLMYCRSQKAVNITKPTRFFCIEHRARYKIISNTAYLLHSFLVYILLPPVLSPRVGLQLARLFFLFKNIYFLVILQLNALSLHLCSLSIILIMCSSCTKRRLAVLMARTRQSPKFMTSASQITPTNPSQHQSFGLI